MILEIDGQVVGNDGTVVFRNRERMSFDYVLSRKFAGQSRLQDVQLHSGLFRRQDRNGNPAKWREDEDNGIVRLGAEICLRMKLQG